VTGSEQLPPSGPADKPRALTPARAACALLAALMLAAWIAAIVRGRIDHDESEHIHVIWLITQGQRPFYDFFEGHPPFPWYPLALVLRATGETYAVLFAYRLVTAIGHLAVFAGLALNVRLSLAKRNTPLPAHVLGLALLVIAGNVAVLTYLAEFRLDAWPNAVLLLAIYRYRRHSTAATGGALRSSIELGLGATAALLCSPKLVLLPALFAGASLLGADRRLVRVAGMAAGAAAALVLGCTFLLAAGLDPRDVYHMSITYQLLMTKHGGWEHGLLQSVWSQKVLCGVIAGSVVAWILVQRRRVATAPFELAIVLFLGGQLALVAFTNKQYYGPWFILGAALVPYLVLAAARWRPLVSLLLAAGVAYSGYSLAGAFRAFAAEGGLAGELEYRRWTETVVPRQGTVAAAMVNAPWFRRRAFYYVIGTASRTSYQTEHAVRDIGREPFATRMRPEALAAELERNQPDLVLLSGWFTPAQRSAVDQYLGRHRDRYRLARRDRWPAYVRLPDAPPGVQ
jgi:hypothetical protein